MPASTTVIGPGKRFDDQARSHVERANAKLVKAGFGLLAMQRRTDLRGKRPSIDLDPTDTEVYGRKKRGLAHNSAPRQSGEPSERTAPRSSSRSASSRARVGDRQRSPENDKTSETLAIASLIKSLNPAGRVVTADAMHREESGQRGIHLSPL